VRHIDYTWELYPNYLLFDKEIDVSNLGWNEGDKFELVISQGRQLLKKIIDTKNTQEI
jgi:hypothetical protein